MLLTIIIPMRNEEAHVAGCLDSVLSQIAGRDDVEVLCVDGASTDKTRTIILDYARRVPQVRLIDNPRGIVPTGMNAAIAQARGRVIMRLDCHCRYAPDYVDRCLAVLERTGADNVGGYMQTVPASDTPVGRAISAATSSPFGVGGSRFRTGGGEMEVDTVPFGCFRRDAFERFGLYDERLARNQDMELNRRIKKGGGTIVISPEIRLTYYNRATFSGLRQQSFYNGLWNPYTIYLVGGGLRPRHLVPLGFVLSLLVCAAVGTVWWPAWIVLAGTVLLYLAAATAIIEKAAREARVPTVLVLLAFIQLHFVYGFGSLCGVVSAPFKFGISRRHQTGQTLPDRRD